MVKKTFIMLCISVLFTLFFLGPQPNFKYDVNYVKVSRHYEALHDNSSYSYKRNYILNQLANFNFEIDLSNDKISFSSTSNRPNAKNILYVARYNSNKESNDIILSSIISTLQTIELDNSANNITFLFISNADDTDLGFSEFLNTEKDLLSSYDYVFTFGASSGFGDLYIYNSSINNSEIVNFYSNVVTTSNGYYDYANKYEEDYQLLSLAMLSEQNINSTITRFDAEFEKKSMQNYTNSIYELIDNSYSYKFGNTSKSSFFTSYFDGFLIINGVAKTILIVVNIIMLIAIFITTKDYYNNKTILKTVSLLLSIPLVTLLITSIPLGKFLINYTLFNSIINSNQEQIYISTYNIIFSIIFLIIITAVLLSNLHKRIKLNTIEKHISVILSLIIINIVYLILNGQLNCIICLFSLIYTIKLLAINTYKLTFNAISYISVFLIIPIIISSMYYLILSAYYINLKYVLVPVTIYLIALLPIIYDLRSTRLDIEKRI